MNVVKCQVVNHNGKKIIAACMDKDCKMQRLCCLMCNNEFHSSHQNQIVELDDIYTFIEQESNKQVNHQQSYSYGQSQIIQGLEQLTILINNIQKKINEEANLIKSQKVSLQDYLKNKSNFQQGIQNWNQFLEGILQYVEIQNCQLSLAQFKDEQLNQFELRYMKIIKQSEASLQRIFNRMNNPQIYHLCFKENRKHSDIVIMDNCVIKKIKSNSDSMIFADEGFDPSNQSYEFKFDIQLKASWICVGVGNDEGDKLPSYIFDTREKLGHGQYMISLNNYTYHHTNEKFNYQTKGMYFTAGDKIRIRYDHQTKLLEFQKQLEYTTVIMPITDMTKRLYPCALLKHPDDQVQLVETFQM